MSQKALSLNDIRRCWYALPMEANQYTVDQLLTALLVGNSSTAALALAERKWVALRKASLKIWRRNLLNGAFNLPHLINATGLNTQTISGDPDGEEDENQLSAYDIAVIAKHLLQDFPGSDQIYFKTDSSFFEHTDWKPQPDARRHAELPFRRWWPTGQQLYKRWHHLCCINWRKMASIWSLLS